MAKRRTLINNTRLFGEAQEHLVGGVDSPVRSFKAAGVEPLLIKRGSGAYVWDYDNNRYIDYVLSWGALILGHVHPAVMDDVKNRIGAGLNFGATNHLEIELAKIIKEGMGFIEKIRFTNSGTEAVMGAVRLARGYTGREKIVKFENAYHGHADYLLDKSEGIPRDFLRHTIIAPFGDRQAVERIFKKSGPQIAAVIVEPVGGNYGVVRPDYEFLKKLRTVADKYGALLIFDEVITGFRFDFGATTEESWVVPDLICLGKIIGGGLPVGAYGGRKDVMKKLAPLGGVYQAGTFSGNPVVMQAGISTLKELRKKRDGYIKLKDLTEDLIFEIKNEANKRKIGLKASYYGTMFSIRFAVEKQFKKFYGELLENGVYFAPSQFEANFLSFAHTEKDIGYTINAVRNSLTAL